jgi:hypothetical protein
VRNLADDSTQRASKGAKGLETMNGVRWGPTGVASRPTVLREVRYTSPSRVPVNTVVPVATEPGTKLVYDFSPGVSKGAKGLETMEGDR